MPIKELGMDYKPKTIIQDSQADPGTGKRTPVIKELPEYVPSSNRHKIDTSRPILENEDGSFSTEESITVTEPGLNGGRPTNIPTIWNGKRVEDDVAIRNAIEHGESNYPSFNSIDEAVKAAQERSNMIGKVREKDRRPKAAPIVEEIGFDHSDWVKFKGEVAKIESSDKYDVKGGANDHYDGKYQLGKVAKQDAARVLGEEFIGHDESARETFRKDPELQERYFQGYTKANHQYLMNGSEEYRNLNAKERLAILGYAHNQGWSEAAKYLKTGKAEGTDAFGTSGTKYVKAISKALGDNKKENNNNNG